MFARYKNWVLTARTLWAWVRILIKTCLSYFFLCCAVLCRYRLCATSIPCSRRPTKCRNGFVISKFILHGRRRRGIIHFGNVCLCGVCSLQDFRIKPNQIGVFVYIFYCRVSACLFWSCGLQHRVGFWAIFGEINFLSHPHRYLERREKLKCHSVSQKVS